MLWRTDVKDSLMSPYKYGTREFYQWFIDRVANRKIRWSSWSNQEDGIYIVDYNDINPSMFVASNERLHCIATGFQPHTLGDHWVFDD